MVRRNGEFLVLDYQRLSYLSESFVSDFFDP
jgi:hypothetical protein